MKNQHEVHNYQSFRKQQEHKHEKACPLFYGDLAVLDSRFRILAARGMTLEQKTELLLPPAGQRFLSGNLSEGTRVAVRHPLGPLVFSGELLPAGLTVALLPIDRTAGVAGAMCYLSGSGRLAVSPQLRKLAPSGNDPDPCMALENEMQLLDTVLRPETGVNAADYCRRVSEYAGCAVRIDADAAGLPLSVSAHDRARIAAFLLCSFLILRKQGLDGADVTVVNLGDSMEIGITGTPAVYQPEEKALTLPEDPAFAAATVETLPDGRIRFSCRAPFVLSERLPRFLPFLS